MAKNSPLEFERLSQAIHAGEFSPVYLLQGEESFYIDAISKLLEDCVIKPEEKSFNYSVYYGKDVSVKDIIMAAKRFPMMAKHQLIIIKEAQAIKKEHWEQLIPYLEKPLPSTVLVLNYKDKKMDQRTKISKLFLKYTVFNSEKLYDNQIPGWITSYIKKKGKHIDQQAAQLIADFLGNDLSKIANEVDKMFDQIPKEVQLVNTKHVEDSIGISKEFNPFELTKALAEKKFNKAIQIVNYLGENDSSKGNFIIVIATLSNFFQKLMIFHSLGTINPRDKAAAIGVNEFFLNEYNVAASTFSPDKVAKIIGLLKYFDLKSKGHEYTNASSIQLLREIVLRIFAV